MKTSFILVLATTVGGASGTRSRTLMQGSRTVQPVRVASER